MTLAENTPPFLRLPPELRKKIYAYLLYPHPDEEVTTINYTLNFPYFQHPSSTTFTPHHLDLCHCPQRQSTYHIYTRYLCTGPEVLLRPKRESFWLLQQPGRAFNILRPATEEEIDRRPEAAVILTCKLVHQEALPLLYEGRNFMLLTGICSRGRYQAYATQTWLSRLNPLAREHVTALSLLIQSNEEDSRDEDAVLAYRSLAEYILDEVPRLKSLRLDLGSAADNVPMWPFSVLFRREGVNICVMKQVESGERHELTDAVSFLRKCGIEDEESVKECLED